MFKDTDKITKKADHVTSSAGNLLRQIKNTGDTDYTDKRFYNVDLDDVYRPSQHMFDSDYDIDSLSDESWMTHRQRKTRRRRSSSRSR